MKRIYSDLQARMAKRLLQPVEQEENEDDMYKRVALGKITKKQASSSIRTTKPKAVKPLSNKPGNPQKSNTNFEIFVDEEFTPKYCLVMLC
jgi:hypothetical protein